LSRNGFLDLHVAIRSNDLIWGWSGINAFEWSVLLELVAALTGLTVGHMHFSISSLHIYEPHWERARAIGDDKPVELRSTKRPGITSGMSLGEWDKAVEDWFEAEFLIRTGQRDPFENRVPLLQAWLEVLDEYWNGEGTAS
jgi:thymidylate synthase